MKVKVIKYAGETGLRLIGTEYEVDDKTAAFLLGKGLIEIPVKKEEKAVIETKEEKFHKPKITKKRK